jgi:hypothetical protein
MARKGLVFRTGIVAFALAVSGAPAAAGAGGRWDEIPLPPGRGDVSDLGIEPGGTLWAVLSGTLHYWDGARFREPATTDVVASPYPMHLYGGGDRPLYAAQAGSTENSGRLYHLSDGRALYRVDYYHANPHAPPSVAVSRTGQLVHWGDRFLAVLLGDDWTRVEALLHDRETTVVETETKLFFYYNGRLYAVDRTGLVTQREIDCPVVSVPGRNRIHAALWGGDRLFLFEDGTREVHGFQLETGRRVDVARVKGLLERARAHDLFGLPSGAVWILVFDFDRNRFVWWEVGRDGSVEPTGNTEVLGWRNLRRWQYPRSVLALAEGTIWFGTPRDGIGRWRALETHLFDWRSGIGGEIRVLCEGPGSVIYAASGGGIFRFDPNRPPQTEPSWVSHWEEYRLSAGAPLRDGEGRLWMFLEDRPGEVSRWDGSGWTQFEVPFETRKVGRMVADDRGHLLVTMSAHPDGCFDVGPEGVERLASLEDLLETAASAGARRFFPEPSIRGCVVQDDGRIWFAYQGYQAVHLYDGERWDQLTLREPVYDVFEGAGGEIRIRTQSDRFFTYDRGQLVERPPTAEDRARVLFGSGQAPPYEEEAARLGVQTFVPGFRGGHWSRFPREPAFRFLGSKAIPCDFRRSPPADRTNSIEAILEDAGGNLWIDTGPYFGTRSVFLKKLSTFEIRADTLPLRARRTLALEPEVSFAGEPVGGALLFWRLDGGAWQGGDSARVEIEFRDDGRHEIEVAAMDPLGGLTPKALRWTLDVEVERPEVHRTGEGVATCDDLLWEIPALAVPSGEGRAAHLAYRFEGGDWMPAHRGKFVLFAGKEPGDWRVEVTAVEEERYFDPRPLVFDVRFTPDYPAIVARRLDRKQPMTVEDAHAALLELRLAGEPILPLVRERLEEARRAAQALPILEALVGVLENPPDR